MSRKELLSSFKKYEKETEERVNYGIENYRKGNFCITVTDKDGNPVKNAKIKLDQKTHEFKYGANIFMLDELETEEKNEKYKKYFSEAFNMATFGFYWDALEPEQGKPRYDKDSPKVYRRPPIDLCLEFCEKHGIEPREHALAYEKFFPKWAKKLPTPELKKLLTKRYKEISERYADKMHTIEVTNETMWEDSPEQSAFYHDNDFIEWCFNEAEKFFPNNQLVINEWSGIWRENVTNRVPYYMLIERALNKGARIDAVGMQFHVFTPREREIDNIKHKYNPKRVYNVLDKYSEFGLPIQITEVTVPAYSDNPEDEEVQAELIRNLYRIWFSHKNVEQIIYWNTVDGYAHVWDDPDVSKSQGNMTLGENIFYGGLLRFDLSPKPAYYAIKDLFEKEWHTEAEIETDAEGNAYFKGFYGDYSLNINGKEYTVKALKNTPKDVYDTRFIKVEL